jgi:small subunit ribosomal protein S1
VADEEEDFAAMLDASFAGQAGAKQSGLSAGARTRGTVVQIGKDTVFVDVGTRSEGQIARWELEDHEGNLRVKVGDQINATVASGGDRPTLVTAIGKSGSADAGMLEMAAETGSPVDGEVTKAVKGGLEIRIGKTRAFCPASMVDIGFTPDISIFEGQTLRFRVLEVRENGRNVIVSRKALLQEEREAQGRDLMSTLEEGQVVEGTVQSTQAYGAFVDLGGLEGLIHISELGHGRVANVTDVVSVGEKVKVRVLGIEASEGDGIRPRIRLSMRQAGEQSGATGGGGDAVVEATVTKVEGFGVLVDTEQGAGVVPNREMDLPPGGDARRVYPVGTTVRVVAKGKDNKGRLRFSIKGVEDAEARQNYTRFRSQSREKTKGSMGSFGELLRSKLDDD